MHGSAYLPVQSGEPAPLAASGRARCRASYAPGSGTPVGTTRSARQFGNRPSATDIGMVADGGPSGVPPAERRRARRDATACAPTGSGAADVFSQLPMGVPPVGVEPTLGTLLGGRPLPLGYGGWVMIPRLVGTILAQANRGRKIHPGAQIQFTALRPRMRSVTNLPNFCIHRVLSVAALRAGHPGREPAAVPSAHHHAPPAPTPVHYRPFTPTARRSRPARCGARSSAEDWSGYDRPDPQR